MRGYPRPQFRRDELICLDGEWSFALDEEGDCLRPADVNWTSKIEVPFAPETARSGIGYAGFFRACWYKRELKIVARDGARLLLHFGAVDYRATVWVDER